MNHNQPADRFAAFVLAAAGLAGFGFQSLAEALHGQALMGSRIGVEYAPRQDQQRAHNGQFSAAAQSAEPTRRSGDASRPRSGNAARATANRSIPRTLEGKPDFQGMWLNNTATPLERPRAFADRAFFTEDEAAEFEKTYQVNRLRDAVTFLNVDPDFEVAASGLDIDTYEPGHVMPNRRTSLIVDPPDGKVPALTPEGQHRLAAFRDRIATHYGDGPENLTTGDRCLAVGNTAVPPLLPLFYNNHLQVVQTADYMAIVSETIHDARIIPVRPRPHFPAGIAQWKGDSIGHWEGDTLVVDTTNFSDKMPFRGSGPNMHLIERFSFLNPGTLSYSFTVDDPETFTRPFTAESALVRATSRMFEYACHEGNYSMTGTLRGARAKDKATSETATGK